MSAVFAFFLHCRSFKKSNSRPSFQSQRESKLPVPLYPCLRGFSPPPKPTQSFALRSVRKAAAGGDSANGRHPEPPRLVRNSKLQKGWGLTLFITHFFTVQNLFCFLLPLEPQKGINIVNDLSGKTSHQNHSKFPNFQRGRYFEKETITHTEFSNPKQK